MTADTDTKSDSSALFFRDVPLDNVVIALAKVMAELPGIGKDSQSPQGYAYRGIEQVTKEAQRLFAKHSVVIAPHRIKWYPPREITVNNRPWTDERCKVTYRVYGPGGAGDYIEVTTVGIGRDNSDKGSNKALTQAYKYALLEALMIADAKDDLEERHEAERPIPAGWGSWEECDEAHNDLRERVKSADPDVRRKWNGYKTDSKYSAPFTRPEYDELDAQLSIIESEGAHRVGAVEAPVRSPELPAPTPAPSREGDGTGPADSMVPDEMSGQAPAWAAETLPADDAKAGPVLPHQPGPARVDPVEWVNGQPQPVLDEFNAWRSTNDVPAAVSRWKAAHHKAFTEWVHARTEGQ